jgi:LytS/YehU family sensor histidine kinase
MAGLIIIPVILIIALIIWLGVELSKEKKKSKSLDKKIKNLASENSVLKAEQLKFQLQPHTFNNLVSHLKRSANKLNNGLHALSDVLDYILYSGRNHFVSVEQELAFIKDYLNLNEILMSEIDAIQIDSTQVDTNSKHFTSQCIPHLISAYFLENAFKHGEINESNPLKIVFKLDDNSFEMTVSNSIKNKATVSNGGIGINNMKERLEILFPKKHEIRSQISDNEYHAFIIIKL